MSSRIRIEEEERGFVVITVYFASRFVISSL
jgi:hypothetical protein